MNSKAKCLWCKWRTFTKDRSLVAQNSSGGFCRFPSQHRLSRSLSGFQECLPTLKMNFTDKSPLLKTTPRDGGPAPTSPQ